MFVTRRPYLTYHGSDFGRRGKRHEVVEQWKEIKRWEMKTGKDFR